MNLSDRMKGFFHGFLILALLGGTAVTMLYPELLGYPFSIKEIPAIQGELESTTNQLARNETSIADRIRERDAAEVAAEEARKEAENIRQSLNRKDFEYHLPSLLITFEQAAFDIGITDDGFFIQYDQIRMNQGGALFDERPDQGLNREPQERPTGEEGFEEDLEYPEDSTAHTAPPSGSQGLVSAQYDKDIIKGDPSLAMAYDVAPNIPGIGVTTIPLRLIGVTYTQAREYVAFLDDLDFVEPSYMDLYSDGQRISIVILAHVFYSEGGF